MNPPLNDSDITGSGQDELFELCKAVYEATGWTDTLQCIWNGQVSMPEKSVVDYGIESKYEGYSPLYTSDYLLDRLPDHVIYDGRKHGLRMIRRVMDIDKPEYERYVFKYVNLFVAEANTPLKALLKLTIALHEGGLLS